MFAVFDIPQRVGGNPLFHFNRQFVSEKVFRRRCLFQARFRLRVEIAERRRSRHKYRVAVYVHFYFLFIVVELVLDGVFAGGTESDGRRIDGKLCSFQVLRSCYAGRKIIGLRRRRDMYVLRTLKFVNGLRRRGRRGTVGGRRRFGRG